MKELQNIGEKNETTIEYTDINVLIFTVRIVEDFQIKPTVIMVLVFELKLLRSPLQWH